MQINYRKNDSWNTLSLNVPTLSGIDYKIKTELSKLNTKDNIDIVDVNITTTTSRAYRVEYQVVVFYALIRSTKRKEI